jgi:hypothetical protein
MTIFLQKDDFIKLHTHAYARSSQRLGRERQERDTINSLSFEGVVILFGGLGINASDEYAQYLQGYNSRIDQYTKAHERIAKLQFIPTETPDVKLSEQNLMLLLQWSYGIRRSGNNVEILLSLDGTKKMSAKGALFTYIEKYQTYEHATLE